MDEYKLLWKNGYKYDPMVGAIVDSSGVFYSSVVIDGVTITSVISEEEYNINIVNDSILNEIGFTPNKFSSVPVAQQKQQALLKIKYQEWKKENYQKHLKIIDENPGVSFNKGQDITNLLGENYSLLLINEILVEKNQIKKRDSIILFEKEMARKESMEEIMGWTTQVLGYTLFIALIIITLRKIFK